MDANRLSTNPCLSKKDFIEARWHIGNDKEKMLERHASLCLNLLGANKILLEGASRKMKGHKDFRGIKDVFDNELVLDYMR